MAGPFDNHFLILAPDLPGIWFTQAARQFWLRFQPAVLADWQSLDQIPADKNILVTLLARPQSAPTLQEQIKDLHPNLHLDIVVADDLTMMEAQLNQRAESGQPLGVAE